MINEACSLSSKAPGSQSPDVIIWRGATAETRKVKRGRETGEEQWTGGGVVREI